MGSLTAVVGLVLDGRYRAEHLLGGGGMGAVWRGRDLRLDRPVAIKVLTGPGLADPVALKRFDREARAVARLAHPNIVAVYDFSTDGGNPFLVMELVEGRSVAELLAAGALPVGQAVAIAMQTCDGLAAAHRAGVVHRDIKPANLILTPAGAVKICDFGIARLQHVAGQTNLTGKVMLGTSAYMAPEQIAGAPVDARTDLYALGCTMYAMLTGAPPFVGDTPLSIVHQHVNRLPAPLHTRRGEIPPALDALVGQLLAKNPADRPADAAQVKSRLVELTGEPAVAVTPGPVPQPPAASDPAALTPEAPRPSAVPGAAAGTGQQPPPAGASVLSRVLGPPAPVQSAGTPRQPRRVGPALARLTGLGILLAMLTVTANALWPVERPSPTAKQSPAAAPSSAPVAPTPSPKAAPASVAARAATQARQSTPARPSTPAPPSDPIAAMRVSIQRQVQTGQLNPKAAEDLHKKVDEIAREINDGNTAEVDRRAGELRGKLVDLRDAGKLSPAGYDELVADLDRLTGQAAQPDGR